MKKIIFAFILTFNMNMFSQSEPVLGTPESLIRDFFIAFHKQDTIQLKKFAIKNMNLASVSLDNEGKTKLNSSDYSQFLKGIASIPAEASFREELHDFRVEENGLLATVTTPYTFYYNNNLSHCGVNSFQMVKFGGEWKVTYLIDTRTKDCD